MATLVDKLNSIVWNEKWWLGDDAKWDDFLSSDPNIYYPRVKDMNWSLAVGVGLLAVRYVYENVLIVPLANYLGIYERKKRPLAPNAPLEAAFRKHRGKVPQVETEKLIKQTDLTERQIQRWLFRRRIQSSPSSMYKFKECSWHLLFYTFAFLYGMWSLWNKSWLYVTVNCWINWPKQHIDTEIYTFYLLELSFYWSLLFAIIFQKDYQKKDKNEMILHHCVTILLIYFSWACNFVRVGTLVLVVHDVADPWLAVAKMAKYAKKQATCEAFFGIFSVVWIISRCCIYPLWVLNTSAVEIHDYVTTFPAYWFFNGLLFVLQILHLLWTYLILRIAFQKFQHGSLQKDERSESESETDETSSDEDEDNNKISKRVISNGILGNQYKSQLTAEQ
ncbi:ceramide synthase 2-like [Pomacea canaliculata]|uniref:ceramide synthase 2-like n=1 Tax=Pomacea canaliculata TaxID=400727 RepID=UPI000D72C84F|nr:ceramide synthase 2-like [Pomacea canaliculata]